MPSPSLRFLLLGGLVVATQVASYENDLGAAGKQPPPPPLKGRNSDVKYIKCAVCKHAAEELMTQVRTMRTEKSDKKLKPTENDYAEILDSMCDPEKPQGEWVRMIDLVEKGDKLLVDDQGVVGKCGKECKTVSLACQEVFNDLEAELTEELWSARIDEKKFVKEVCKKRSKACSKPPPPLGKHRKAGPEFKPMTEKDLEVEKLMKKMQTMPEYAGMGMHAKTVGEEEETNDED